MKKLVVLRESKQNVEKIIGPDWEESLLMFSRVIGFSLEIDEEIKLEFNPDRPDLFSLYSLKESMENFAGNVRKRGTLNSSKRLLQNNKPASREFAAAFEVDYQQSEIGAILDSVNYLDRLSETVGKKRKQFAFGVHDNNKISGNITYDWIDTASDFETYDLKSGKLRDLLNEHPKGIEYKNILEVNMDTGKIWALNDEKGPISIPPFFNSGRTRVDQNTKNILVDITSTSLYGLIQGLRLSLGYFQKLGIDCKLLSSMDTEYAKNKLNEMEMEINKNAFIELTGIKSDERDIMSNLTKMGYSGDIKKVKVPLERIDVMGMEDLIEDFVKAYGINNIKEKPLVSSFTGKFEDMNYFSSKLRNLMVSLGFQEVINFVLRGNGGDDSIKILNTKSDEYSILRKDMLYGFLDFYQRNKQYGFPQKIFEIGDVFLRGNQYRSLGVSTSGRHSNYSEIKGYLDRLLNAFTDIKPLIVAHKSEELIDGRSGIIEVNGIEIGLIGEANPELIGKYTFNFPVTYFQINLEKLYQILKPLVKDNT